VVNREEHVRIRHSNWAPTEFKSEASPLNQLTWSYRHCALRLQKILLGRGRTKETGNRNATAISENCYQPELNIWN
jgi:hypothetical protein